MVKNTTNNAGIAGIQGNAQAGRDINVVIKENKLGQTISDEDVTKLLSEITTIKKELLKSSDSNDEDGIILGNVSNASKLLKENKKGEAIEFLKKCGQRLLDLAIKIGCSLIVEVMKK